MKKIIGIVLAVILIVVAVKIGTDLNKGAYIKLETLALTKDGSIFSNTMNGTLKMQCENTSFLPGKLQAGNFTIESVNAGTSYFGSNITIDDNASIDFSGHDKKTVFLKFTIDTSGMSAGAIISFYYNSMRFGIYRY